METQEPTQIDLDITGILLRQQSKLLHEVWEQYPDPREPFVLPDPNKGLIPKGFGLTLFEIRNHANEPVMNVTLNDVIAEDGSEWSYVYTYRPRTRMLDVHTVCEQDFEGVPPTMVECYHRALLRLAQLVALARYRPEPVTLDLDT